MFTVGLETAVEMQKKKKKLETLKLEKKKKKLEKKKSKLDRKQKELDIWRGGRGRGGRLSNILRMERDQVKLY